MTRNTLFCPHHWASCVGSAIASNTRSGGAAMKTSARIELLSVVIWAVAIHFLDATVSPFSTYACSQPSTEDQPVVWFLACSASPANPVCVSFTNVPPSLVSSSQRTLVCVGIHVEIQVYARRRGGSSSRISPSILKAPMWRDEPEVD